MTALNVLQTIPGAVGNFAAPCIILKTTTTTTTVAQQVQASSSSSSSSNGSGIISSRLAKKERGLEPELLRCKRRIDFSGLGFSLPRAQPAAVARRNERERNRVKLVNLGFETLREHIPNGRKNKKMSKVETLRSAVQYIKQLQSMLTAEEFVSLEQAAAGLRFSPATSDISSPSSSLCSDSSDPFQVDDDDLLDFSRLL